MVLIMIDKETITLIFDKFTKEKIHELVRKVFQDAILVDIDLDWAYYDLSEVDIDIIALNGRTKKPITIKKKINVAVNIELTFD